MSGEFCPLLLDTSVLEAPVPDVLSPQDDIEPEALSLGSRLGDIASGRNAASRLAALAINLEHRQEQKAMEQTGDRNTAIGLIGGAALVGATLASEYLARKNGWSHIWNHDNLFRLANSSLTSSTLIVRTGGAPDPDQQELLLDKTSSFFEDIKAKKGRIKSAIKAMLPF